MLIGIAVLITGFIIMSLDSEEFGFGFLGLTLGPLVILAGFGIQFLAIMTHDDVPALEKPTSSPKKPTATKASTNTAKAKAATTKKPTQRKSSKQRKKRTTR